MTLCLHRGGKKATFEEVASVTLPSSTRTWEPIGHVEVLNEVSKELPNFNLEVVDWQHALRNEGRQYFGVATVREICDPVFTIPGISLQIGVRNSVDKSLAASLVAGNKVFVCDNLAFSGEVALSRKHTSNIRYDFTNKVQSAFSKLLTLFGTQKRDIEDFQCTHLPEGDRDQLITRAMRNGIMPPSKFDKLEKQWNSNDPTACGGVKEHTVWRWFNAVTQVIKDSRPDVIAQRTGKLFSLCRDYACTVALCR